MASKKNGSSNNKKDTSTSFQWLSRSLREQVWEREPHREQETQGKIEHEKLRRKGWSAIFSLRERADADEEEEEEASWIQLEIQLPLRMPKFHESKGRRNSNSQQ
jgi:hypothetical protein